MKQQKQTLQVYSTAQDKRTSFAETLWILVVTVC